MHQGSGIATLGTKLDQGSRVWPPSAGNVPMFEDVAAQRRERTSVRGFGRPAPGARQGSRIWLPSAGNAPGFEDPAAQRRERARVRGFSCPVLGLIAAQRWERARVEDLAAQRQKHEPFL